MRHIKYAQLNSLKQYFHTWHKIHYPPSNTDSGQEVNLNMKKKQHILVPCPFETEQCLWYLRCLRHKLHIHNFIHGFNRKHKYKTNNITEESINRCWQLLTVCMTNRIIIATKMFATSSQSLVMKIFLRCLVNPPNVTCTGSLSHTLCIAMPMVSQISLCIM